MRLHGIHHVTCITGDAPKNLAFYTDTLGLRMVKKTVNQDDPTVYHLFYADENGSAGADITFFEYPGAIPGRAGDGMVHRVAFRVGSEASLDFWQERVGGERSDGSLVFDDPEGLELELSSTTALTRLSSRGIPRSPRSTRCAASPACAPTRRRPRAAPTSSRASPSTARARSGSRAATAHRLLRLRRTAGRPPRHPRRRHRAPRRVVGAARRARRLGREGRSRGRAADAGDRPLLVPLDLLPRAERHPVRDRVARPRLHHRRGPRAPRREADPAAGLRAPARAGRAATDAAPGPARA